MRYLKRIAWCGATAMLALATGCSDEPSLSEKYPTQWKTCNTLFGAKNMSALRDIVGPDDLRFTNSAISVDQFRKSLTTEALKPYNKNQGFDEYNVCALSGDHTFSSGVQWAPASLKEVQSPSGRWHRVAPDVYVYDSPIDLVFRCEVEGASKGQQEQVLLEARVNEVGAVEFSEAFHEQLAVRLARTVRDLMRCTNKPDIPNGLAIGE